MLSLAHETRLQGHDVRFLTFRGRGLGAHVAELNYPLDEVKVRAKVDPLAILRMAATFRRRRTQIVHTHLSTSTVNGCLAARFAGVPSVASVHGLSGKLSFVPAGHLIAVSQMVAQHLISQGVDASKISVVYNGTPHGGPAPSPEARASARRALGLSSSAFVLGTTARLTPLKGVDHLIHAFRRILDDFPAARLVIFGDGPAMEEYINLSDGLGMTRNVIFAGYRTDVPELLPALDLFVFPSLREAMGIAIIEAMAAGLPVVATNVGGIPEVVTDECGVLVPPGDSISLADASIAFMRDPERSRSAGRASLERVRSEFTAQRMGAKTVQVYHEMLARKSPFRR